MKEKFKNRNSSEQNFIEQAIIYKAILRYSNELSTIQDIASHYQGSVKVDVYRTSSRKRHVRVVRPIDEVPTGRDPKVVKNRNHWDKILC